VVDHRVDPHRGVGQLVAVGLTVVGIRPSGGHRIDPRFGQNGGGVGVVALALVKRRLLEQRQDRPVAAGVGAHVGGQVVDVDRRRLLGRDEVVDILGVGGPVDDRVGPQVGGRPQPERLGLVPAGLGGGDILGGGVEVGLLARRTGCLDRRCRSGRHLG
jgi:hypothetical protein